MGRKSIEFLKFATFHSYIGDEIDILPVNMFRLIFSLLFSLSLFGEIEHYLKKVEKKIPSTSLEGIDCTYLINLDARKERWIQSLQQLIPYGIWPQRFSAIYGWHLPFQAYQEIGVRFALGMWAGIENALYVPSEGYFQFVRLNEAFYEKSVFSSWLTPGAIGCTLSHLSIIQDALEEGYETIWILEDDFVLMQNPHLLSKRIEELDTLVGKENWDILYTDPEYLCGIDPQKDLQKQLPYKWRPDMPDFDLHTLLEHTPVGENFYKIGSRLRTHSMILRKTAMEKILHFYKTQHLFLPYDHELGFIPYLRFYAISETIVGQNEEHSDTKNRYF
jgi:GR25 family glycosyltransferase involved in LPS biosynthesis